MSSEPQRMAGRVAVVTGAAGGIGHGVCERLLTDGAHVAAVDRDTAALEGLRRAWPEDQLLPVASDLSRPGDRDVVIPSVLERFGRVDILINNAADHGPRTPFLDLPFDEWERVQATNLTAPAALSQQVARDMIVRQSGVIINITAIQERLPLTTYAAYGASKGGLTALTRCLAAELSPHGIRVAGIAPGMIKTDSLDQAAGERTGSPTLLRRDGSPSEIAAAVAFLASDEASFVTGTILTVDGGRTISRYADPLADRLDPTGAPE